MEIFCIFLNQAWIKLECKKYINVYILCILDCEVLGTSQWCCDTMHVWMHAHSLNKCYGTKCLIFLFYTIACTIAEFFFFVSICSYQFSFVFEIKFGMKHFKLINNFTEMNGKYAIPQYFSIALILKLFFLFEWK